MKLARALLSISLACGTLGAAAAEQWFLFDRHGGCSEIGVLKRKLPDMPEIRDPQAFVQYLESKRLRYTRNPLPLPAGKAVEVQAPDAGLALVFVTAETCRSPSGGRP